MTRVPLAGRARFVTRFHPPLQGEGRAPQARGVGCAAMPGVAARLRALSPQPAALRVADAPRRRSLRTRMAAEGRLSTFPLQGKVEKFRHCRRHYSIDNGPR